MKHIRVLFFGITILSLHFLEAEHPIIFMVSLPRSISTAFTRMMYERGDCTIYHEPLYHPYCMIYSPEYAREVYRKGAYSSLEQVKSELFAAADERMVFVKEISNAAEEFLLKDSSFTNHKQLKFVFLLRNPHHAALSFYKKCPEQINALQEFMGYEALFRVYCWVERETKQTPHIILSEDICNHPEETIRAFCEKMQIPFLPEALNWKRLEQTFDLVKEWHEYKFEGPVDLWHGNAISSSGFGRVSQYAVDEYGAPTFEEVENLEDRKTVREAYLYNLRFYYLLKEKLRS